VCYAQSLLSAWQCARAHVLAKATLFHASRATFDVIPSCIASIIMNENTLSLLA
jgi:hypothetical protein